MSDIIYSSVPQTYNLKHKHLATHWVVFTIMIMDFGQKVRRLDIYTSEIIHPSTLFYVLAVSEADVSQCTLNYLFENC